MVATNPAVTIEDRWQKALRRAITNGVQVLQVAGSGAWVATSGSRNVAYQVTATACECEAAALGGDPVCQHRAMFRHLAGLLILVEDEPAPTASGHPTPASETLSEQPMVRCQECLGDGYRKMQTGSRHTDWWPLTCHDCGGSGQVAVALIVAGVASDGSEENS